MRVLPMSLSWPLCHVLASISLLSPALPTISILPENTGWTRPFRDGTLAEPDITAHPIETLQLSPDAGVKTLFVHNSTRMVSRYSDATEALALSQLNGVLGVGNMLMAAGDGKGKAVTIDLGGTALQPADTTTLNASINR